MLQDVEVGLQVGRVNRADDRRVQIGVRESEAEDKLHRAHTIEQVIETRPTPALPLQPSLLPLGWRSLSGAATNYDARPLLSGSGDRRLVFTFDRRVRDLKDIENTHRNMVDQVGKCAGHTDKSDFMRARLCSIPATTRGA